ncbi:hypothetical protein [Caudoviricetes sp.]|nr:hypothetical protein [Caudoviricetes sp.]
MLLFVWFIACRVAYDTHNYTRHKPISQYTISPKHAKMYIIQHYSACFTPVIML